MKVLFVIPHLNKGGAERISIDIVKELLKFKNINIKIIIFQNFNSYQFLTDSIEIIHIQSIFNPSFLKENTVDLKALNKFVNDFKPDIIHLNLFQSIINFSQINYTKAKYIFHFHNNMKQFKKVGLLDIFTKEKITNWYERKLILEGFKNKRVTCIGISKHTFEFISKNTPKVWDKQLLYNGVNVNRFYSDNNSSKLELISIGSLSDNKNHSFLIDTIHFLVTKNWNVHLTILGDGPLKDKLQQKINDYNLHRHVTLKGNIDYPEFFLAKASIYIHTAKSEAFGLVLIEAMAASLPVVTYDAGGNRDLIVHGENGYILNDWNEEVLANQIIELLKNDKKREAMALNARNFAEKFDIKIYTDRLLKIYDS
jgi:glycosyltransferase involved in cell wall biosynthesis